MKQKEFTRTRGTIWEVEEALSAEWMCIVDICPCTDEVQRDGKASSSPSVKTLVFRNDSSVCARTNKYSFLLGVHSWRPLPCRDVQAGFH